MNIFASLIALAALTLPFNSQAQSRPAAAGARASDFNQQRQLLIQQQTRSVTMIENLKKCIGSSAKDPATKAKCDADSKTLTAWLDEQLVLPRIQLKCANSSSTFDVMLACLKRESTALQGAAGANRPGNAQPAKR